MAKISLAKIKVFFASICFFFLDFTPGEKAAVLMYQTRNIFMCHSRLYCASCNAALLFSRGIPTCAIMNVMRVPKNWLILRN